MAASVADVDKNIVLVLANIGHKQMLDNWLYHAKLAQLNNFIVVALDVEMLNQV